MKTYTYGQIQIVRDALELAHDTSEGEINRKIRGAIELLDTPLDAFEEVYRLKDERDALEKSIKIRDLAFTYAMTCGFGLKREAEELAADAARYRWLAENAYVGISLYPMPHEVWCLRLPNPAKCNNLNAAIDAAMKQDALDHVPDAGKMVGQGEQP